jgi:hypothetical protein
MDRLMRSTSEQRSPPYVTKKRKLNAILIQSPKWRRYLANKTANTPFGLLQESNSGPRLVAGKEIVMDTMTYASVAVLPKSVAQNQTHFIRQDLELLPLDLSMIKR